MPPAVATSSSPSPATDIGDLPFVQPTKPVPVWMLRSMGAAWAIGRFGFSSLAFLCWAAGLSLSTARPGALTALAVLIPAGLLSTLSMLIVVRSVAMQLGCDRRRPVRRESAFLMRFRRSAAATGIALAVVAALLFAALRTIVDFHTAWTAAMGFWWWAAAMCLSATAADDSDTIDSLQRILVYHTRHPLIALVASGPVLLLGLGLAALGWVATYGLVELLIAAMAASLVGSLLLASAQGGYTALRYHADRHDPAELLGSGTEWGVLRTEDADHA